MQWLACQNDLVGEVGKWGGLGGGVQQFQSTCLECPDGLISQEVVWYWYLLTELS